MNSQNELLKRTAEPALSVDRKALRCDLARQAQVTLERVADVAIETGDPERAGLAALTLIEQLGHRLTNIELCAIIERAGELLEETHDLSAVRRLERISRQALLWTNGCPIRPDWSTFNLKEECRFVEQALVDANGSVTKAAELLGLASHQSLLYILNGRLKNLLNARTPIKPRRRRSTISKKD
jgi:hypothetical protein